MNNARLTLLFITCFASSLTLANDLNDGIPLDTKLDDTLERDFNTTYIVTKSKGQARSQQRRGSSSKTIILKDGQGAGVGNIEIGAGSNLKGATIINLSNNKKSTVIAD